MAANDSSHNRLLMHIFSFSEQDLLQNRVGKLSTLQSQRLHHGREFLLVDSLMLLGLFLFPAAVFSAIYWQYRLRFGHDAEMLLLWGVGVLTFLAVVLAFGWLMMGQELRSRHIHTTTGRPVSMRVPVYLRDGVVGYEFVVKIGRVRFLVESEHQLQAFNPDLTYRIHYWPHPPTHAILSIETVG